MSKIMRTAAVLAIVTGLVVGGVVGMRRMAFKRGR